MKKITLLYLFAAMVLLHTGCKKFSEFQTDPNKSTTATPDLLLSNIEQKAFQSTDLDIPLASRQLAFTDNVNNFQYYGWNRLDTADFNGLNRKLRQVIKMEQSANAQSKAEYIPLVKFFKSWYFLQLTQMLGDIPYSEALKAEDGLFSPAYDKQEDIYLNILNDLKAANSLINSSTTAVQGDFVYSGNMQQWKRVINSLSLRVLISLSHKENDARLEIKKRFAEIVNDPTNFPILTGNADNAALTFHDQQDNRYPFFNSNDLQTAFYMEESFVNLLKGLQDPRLFSFADKATKYSGLPATDFNAYGGVKGSAPVNDNNARVVTGEISKINPRFYNSPVNEPSIALGYAEVQFILAEGITRGWVGGDANDHYQKGVRASFGFYGIESAASTYLAQATVQLSVSAPLQQIITQKYIASFMNAGWQPFFEQRRTGIPAFDVSGAGALNNKTIPKRWMYPEEELRLNQQHVTEAISRQYPEGDNINGIMWLLK